MFAQKTKSSVKRADEENELLLAVPRHAHSPDNAESQDTAKNKQALCIRVKSILQTHELLGEFRKSAIELGISLDEFAKFLSGLSGGEFRVFVSYQMYDTPAKRSKVVKNFLDAHVKSLNLALHDSLPVLYFRSEDTNPFQFSSKPRKEKIIPDWVSIDINRKNFDSGGSGLAAYPFGYFTLNLGLTENQMRCIPEALVYTRHLFASATAFLFKENSSGRMMVVGIERQNNSSISPLYFRMSGAPSLKVDEKDWNWSECSIGADNLGTRNEYSIKRLFGLISSYTQTDEGALNMFRLITERIDQIYSSLGIAAKLKLSPEEQALIIRRIKSVTLELMGRQVEPGDIALGGTNPMKNGVTRIELLGLAELFHEYCHAASGCFNWFSARSRKMNEYSYEVEEMVAAGISKDPAYDWWLIYEYLETLPIGGRKSALDLILADFFNLPSCANPQNEAKLRGIYKAIFQ